MLTREYPAAEGKSYERRVFWGEDGLTPQFWEALTLQSLFGRSKILIVRRAHALLKDDWDKLSTALNRFYDQAWPFFCLEVAFERNKPKIPAVLAEQKYWIFAQKKRWVWESPPLTPQTVQGYIKDWAMANDMSFGPGVLERLAEVMPADAGAIASELAKIELAVDGRRVVGPELVELVSSSAELHIFEFLNAVQQGAPPAKIWTTILGAQQSGENLLFVFLALLVREVRVLWQLYHGEKNVRVQPWLAEQKRQAAAQLGPARLARILDLAVEAEIGVKSGACNEDQALERMVASLAALFQRRGQSSPARPAWRERG